MQQPHGDDLAGPEMGLGVCGDGAQLLVDLVEQCRDKLHRDHAALLSGDGCHPDQRGEVVGRLQAQKDVLLVFTALYSLSSLEQTNTIGYGNQTGVAQFIAVCSSAKPCAIGENLLSV